MKQKAEQVATKDATNKTQSIEAGAIFTNNNGDKFVIEHYIDDEEIDIKFLDKHECKLTVSASRIKRGKIQNPYRPTLLGVGYIGVGKYKSTENGKMTKAGRAWRGMIARCYCKATQKNQPSYIGCTLHDEWRNFQVFAEWYHSQIAYNNDGNFALDKDLLKKGNKHYSPEYCVLLPRHINNAIVGDGQAKGDELPTGVSKRGKKYRAKVSIVGKVKYFGSFDTKEEAHQTYIREKLKYVRELASWQQHNIEPRAYNALMNEWQPVERERTQRANKGELVEVGYTYLNKQDERYTVINIKDSKHITIKFTDKHAYETVVRATQVRARNIRNPYTPSVCNVGYLGAGKYEAYKPNKGGQTEAYTSWKSMIARCYDSDGELLHPELNLTVDEEWLNFQVFAEWYYSQSYARDGHVLDRDLLSGEHYYYSPSTCTLVPKSLANLLQVDTSAELPTGVSKQGQKYRAQLTMNGVSKYLGTYDTVSSAKSMYATAKTRYIKQQAMQYKDQISNEVFERLINYKG